VKRAALLLMLLATPALADDWDDLPVLTTATKVTGGLTGTGYKTILVENGGSASIYCSRNPAVTTDTGHEVPAEDSRSFPHDGPVYCIAAVAQTDAARDRTIVWGSYK
jgi:hypothetical protein